MTGFVALAAAIGAATRYVVDHALVARTGGHQPWGTFFVNVTGSFAIGLLFGLVLAGFVSTQQQIVFGTGFLGAYTTFSTWMYETVRLAEQKAWRLALFHGLGALMLGPLATALGLFIGASL